MAAKSQHTSFLGKDSSAPRGSAGILKAMAEPPDLASLAKRYVDLWQDQLIAMAADPALAESTARLLAALVPSAWPGKQHDEPHPRASQSHASSYPPGPAPAGAPFDERDRGLAELARRLAAVEERLAAVEAGIRGSRRSAQPRAARRERKKSRRKS